jgi:putative SOS response-associated peptidase YedK
VADANSVRSATNAEEIGCGRADPHHRVESRSLMCGRYISRVEAAIEREWMLRHQPPLFESWNIAPTAQVPIVRQQPEGREVALVRWGLVPFFAKGEPLKRKSPTGRMVPASTHNARIETFETAPSYRGPWKRGQRCLQIASGFFEWHTFEDGRKAPFYIHLADQDTYAFASLWDRSEKSDGTVIESCTIITMPANDLMHHIHNTGSNPHRMPAMLKREDHDVWLNGTVDEARGALYQYDQGLMVAYEVAPRVNSTKNNGATLIDPVAAAETGL